MTACYENDLNVTNTCVCIYYTHVIKLQSVKQEI